MTPDRGRRGPGGALATSVTGSTRPGFPLARSLLGLLLSLMCAVALADDRFETTGSRSGYVHRLELYDARDRRVDPTARDARPYSSRTTCGKCHDYERIARGYHFRSPAVAGEPSPEPGRPGEPWILTDRRTATQVPLSYRRWDGTFHPSELGVTDARFVREFGRHLPGQIESPGSDEGLPVDCMICHGAPGTFQLDVWSEQIEQGNRAWASTAATGLARIEGSARGRGTDAPSANISPRTIYDSRRFDAEGRVFFDVVRRPTDDACYACHTTRSGRRARPRWTEDEDVHLGAGLGCADCHRNGLDHHTVRGFEGEEHPSGASVTSLTCRGCHRSDAGDGSEGGRLGAPAPHHGGLPSFHLERLSCPSCHSGLRPESALESIETSRSHALGIPRHRGAGDPPYLFAPVFRPDERGILSPYRLLWPSFWAVETEDRIRPLGPAAVYPVIRRILRIRRDLRAEQGDRFLTELPRILEALGDSVAGGTPVYVTGDRVLRVDEGTGKVATARPSIARPYLWPLAHDVRPASRSLGSGGCLECHAMNAPFFAGTVAVHGAAVDGHGARPRYEWAGLDPRSWRGWAVVLRGRSFFLGAGFVSLAIVLVVLARRLLVPGSPPNGTSTFHR